DGSRRRRPRLRARDGPRRARRRGQGPARERAGPEDVPRYRGLASGRHPKRDLGVACDAELEAARALLVRPAKPRSDAIALPKRREGGSTAGTEENLRGPSRRRG